MYKWLAKWLAKWPNESSCSQLTTLFIVQVLADGTCLISKAYGINVSANEPITDLQKIGAI